MCMAEKTALSYRILSAAIAVCIGVDVSNSGIPIDRKWSFSWSTSALFSAVSPLKYWVWYEQIDVFGIVENFICVI